MDLQSIAQVELTSEDEAFPFEAALNPGGGSWRAGEAGEQTIRLLFDAPQHLTHIRLIFQEDNQQRTQQFLLRWCDDAKCHDIARQQYNFSAPDSTIETENFEVNLMGVTSLELCITPDISGGNALASLAEWRVA
ncbi:MAG: hypothetical protein AUK35_06995 [Zetaproteobacteria bacterium CG2_30_46_52]|nr:MAG: hypothetical protein AUK35_06995 [Zetaproteobacteria bacterium CG2_30_46_52]